jgi:hypothetical protein
MTNVSAVAVLLDLFDLSPGKFNLVVGRPCVGKTTLLRTTRGNAEKSDSRPRLLDHWSVYRDRDDPQLGQLTKVISVDELETFATTCRVAQVPTILAIRSAEQGAEGEAPCLDDLRHLRASIARLADRIVWLHRPALYRPTQSNDPQNRWTHLRTTDGAGNVQRSFVLDWSSTDGFGGT